MPKCADELRTLIIYFVIVIIHPQSLIRHYHTLPNSGADAYYCYKFGSQHEIRGTFIYDLTSWMTFSTPPPRTITITFEEDASGLLWQYSTRATLTSESTIVDRWDRQSCNFQGTTAGTCVEIAHFPSLEGNFTFTNSDGKLEGSGS
ncbi:hypothetical protein Agabi119p4_1393 [Agaricus bisporus var. burnettii]|uniref:Uncharacterized protein n=1 Tax=Agaricus bisporus var. burnettii TaxID=192524 RepID=A0A8H7KLN5_AGABI|nr:hypothetical protein Agabi119p4_1393 [Agaricus bisporus var. burnettii]